ncbi:MAG: DUF4038 domain-containing protein [Candidatus Marinimicrobia bacterium]|nr:DUF4038 domain-containing protein [Candidatus Neomarinimicrobiota bacterium]
MRLLRLLIVLLILVNIPVDFLNSQSKPYEVVEYSFKAKTHHQNPYLEAFLPDRGHYLLAEFTEMNGQRTYNVPGFWDGANNWKVRFAPPNPGTWQYTTHSKDTGLDGHSGTFTVESWGNSDLEENPIRRGFIQVNEDSERAGRYFQYADGTPFLWIGDTWWNWSKENIEFSSFEKLVADRIEKRFTLGQLFVAANGWGDIASILENDFTELDVGHMQKVDSMIAHANESGLVVWVHGWWSRKNIRERIGEEKIQRWWKYLVSRLSAYNVIWVLAGEYNLHDYGGFSLAFWNELGGNIKEWDPYERITSTHPTPPYWGGGADAPQWSTAEVIHTQPWLDYNQSQTGHGKWRNEMTPEIIRNAYEKTPAKPIVITEPWYEFVEGNPTAMDIRFGAWSAFLSGAAGHSYGGGHVWKAHLPESPMGADTWPMDLSFETNTLDYPGAVSMSVMSKFLHSIDWWKLEPHPELVVDYAEPYCAADPGNEYVIYLRYGGAAKIDLSDLPSGAKFQYKWLNPSNGKIGGTGELESGNRRIINAPGGYPSNPDVQDWVIHIVKQ